MEKTELPDLLSYAAEHWPTNIALKSADGKHLSYLDYFSMAHGAALSLTEIFPAVNSVCLLSSKSISSLIILQGILRTGACYIPLNPFTPFHINYQFFIESFFDLLVIDAKMAPPEMLQDTSIKRIQVMDDSFLVVEGGQDRQSRMDGKYAYILFTSGSTGTPKGVMMTHSNTMYFLNWCSNTFMPQPHDSFSSIAPCCFDLSVLDIFLPIKHGSCLAVFSEAETKNPRLMADYMQEFGLTHMYATPTFFKSLLIFGNMQKRDYSKIKRVLFAGEIFQPRALNQLRQLLPTAEFYNLYGPTETNVCTFYKLPSSIENDRDIPYPIGKPCKGTSYKIKEGGQTGMLLISGPGVMSGYYQNTNASKQKLQGDDGGIVWYDTGDIVRVDTNDNLIFISRQDRQIKRKGYRIELDEIELAVSSYDSIVECAATTVLIDEVVLITVYVVTSNNDSFSLQGLREYLMQKFESYKMPDKFVICDSLPKTISGKTDYSHLKHS